MTCFLSRAGKESDDNLAFVRNRLLKSEADLTALLDLYRQMRRGRRVRDDETNPLCGMLKMSGVCRVESGLLMVRNRIYHQVFDVAWVEQHLPDAELRRQKAAFRRGLAMAGSLAGVIVSLMAGLTVLAVHNAHTAYARTKEAHDSALAERRSAIAAQQSATEAKRSESEKAWALKHAEGAKKIAEAAKIEAETKAIEALNAKTEAVRQTRRAQNAASAKRSRVKRQGSPPALPTLPASPRQQPRTTRCAAPPTRADKPTKPTAASTLPG